MAIMQVRVKLGDSWTSLAYNETTGRWEGEITAPGTSAHQPGGYYPLTVEATNETGQTDTLSGAQHSGLRLIVRETTAPALTLVSPTPGYLTTGTPVFTIDATDEAGGSGVDPDSFSPRPSSMAAIPGGYRFTWAPSARWEDGPQTVSFRVRDYDGNESAISAAYLVDTLPPDLTVDRSELRHVVDWDEIALSGQVRDDTSGVSAVTVAGRPVEVDGVGRFFSVVPLAVGENNVRIAAIDKAGLETSETVWMLRLITDRTQADVDAIAALYSKHWEDFSQEEKAFWNGVVRGAYNASDLNRVGVAVDYLTRELTRRGYAPATQPKTDWTETDALTVPSAAAYLTNVVRIREQLPVHAPDVPPDMAAFTFQEANDIEANLVETDRFSPLMDKSPFYSGEIFCGE